MTAAPYLMPYANQPLKPRNPIFIVGSLMRYAVTYQDYVTA
jgi:hypothetical protein